MESRACSYSQGSASSPSSYKDNVLSAKNGYTCDTTNLAAVIRDARVLSNDDASPLDLSPVRSKLAEQPKLQTPTSDAYRQYLSNSICNSLPGRKNDFIVNFDSFSCNSGSNYYYQNPEGAKFSRCNPLSFAPTYLYDNEGKDLQLPYGLGKVCDVPNSVPGPFSPICTKTGILTPNQEGNDSRSFCDSGYNSFSAPNSNRTKFTVRSTPTQEPIKDCRPTCKTTPCITLDADFDNLESHKDSQPTYEAVPCITLDSDSDFSDIDISAEDLRKELNSQDEDALLNVDLDPNKSFLNILSAAKLRGESSESFSTKTGLKTLVDSTSSKENRLEVSAKKEGFSHLNKKCAADSGLCEESGDSHFYLDEHASGKIDLNRAEFAANALRLWSKVQTNKISSNSNENASASNFDVLAVKSKVCAENGQKPVHHPPKEKSPHLGVEQSNDRGTVENSKKKYSSLKKPKRSSSKGKCKNKIDDLDIKTSPAVHWSVKLDECAVDLGKPLKLTFRRQVLSEVSPSCNTCPTNEDGGTIQSSSKTSTFSIKSSESVDNKVQNEIVSPGISVSSTVSQSPELNTCVTNAEARLNSTLSEKLQQIVCPSSNLPTAETKTLDKKLPLIVCPSSDLPVTETKTLSEKPPQIVCPSSSSPSTETKTLSEKSPQIVCPSSSLLTTETQTLSEKQIVCPSFDFPLSVTNDCDTFKSSVEKPSNPKDPESADSKIKCRKNEISCPDPSVSPAVSESPVSSKSAQNQEISVNPTFNEKSEHKVCSSSNTVLAKNKDSISVESSSKKPTSSLKNSKRADSKTKSKKDVVSWPDISFLSAVAQAQICPSAKECVTRRKYVSVVAVEDSEIPVCFSGPSTFSLKNSRSGDGMAKNEKKKSRTSDMNVLGELDVSVPECFSEPSTSSLKNSQSGDGTAKNEKKKSRTSDINVSSELDVSVPECFSEPSTSSLKNSRSGDGTAKNENNKSRTSDINVSGELDMSVPECFSEPSTSSLKNSRSGVGTAKNENNKSRTSDINVSGELDLSVPECFSEPSTSSLKNSRSGVGTAKNEKNKSRTSDINVSGELDVSVPKCFSEPSTFSLKNSHSGDGMAKNEINKIGTRDTNVSGGREASVPACFSEPSTPSFKNSLIDSGMAKNEIGRVDTNVSGSRDIGVSQVVSQSPVSNMSSENCESPVNLTLKETPQQKVSLGPDLSWTKDKEVVKKSSKKSIFSLKNFILKKSSKTLKNFITKKKIKNKSRSLDISTSSAVLQSSSVRAKNLEIPVNRTSSEKPQPLTKKIDSDSDENSSINSTSSLKNSESANCDTQSKKNEIGNCVVSSLPSVSLSLKKCVINLGRRVKLVSSGKPVLKVSPSSKIHLIKNQDFEIIESSSEKPSSSLKNSKSADSKTNCKKSEISCPDLSVSPAISVSQSSISSKSAQNQGTPVSLTLNEKAEHKVSPSSNIILTKNKDSITVKSSSKKPTSSLKSSRSPDSKTKFKKNETICSDSSVSPSVSQFPKSSEPALNQATSVNLTSSEKSKHKVCPSSDKIFTKNKNSVTVESSTNKPAASLKDFKSADSKTKSKKSEITSLDIDILPAVSQPAKLNTSAQNQGTPVNLTSNEKPEQKVGPSPNITSTKYKSCASVGSSSKKPSSGLKNSKSDNCKAKSKKNDGGNPGIKASPLNRSLQSKPSKPSKAVMFAEFGEPIILTVNKKPKNKIHPSSNLQLTKDNDSDTVKFASESAASSVKDSKIIDNKTKNKKNDAGSVLPIAACDVSVAKSECHDASSAASGIKLCEVSDKSQAKDFGSLSTGPASCDKSVSTSSPVTIEADLKNDSDSSADKCSTNSSSSCTESQETVDVQDKDIADSSISSTNLSTPLAFMNSKTTTHILNSSAVTKTGEIFSNPNVSVMGNLEKSIVELASDSQLQVNATPANTNQIDKCINSECLSEKITCHAKTLEKVPDLLAKSGNQNENVSAPAVSTSFDSDTKDSNSAADVSETNSALKPKLSLADYLGRSNSQSRNRFSVDSDSSIDSYLPNRRNSDCAGADGNNSTNSSRKKSDGSRGVSLSLTADEILIDTSFEKVVSDASKKLSSPFSSKFLSSVFTPDKQASGVQNAGLTKIIPDDDNINNNYKTSCTVASPDKILFDQQKAKIADSMSPKNTFEHTVSETGVLGNSTAPKSPSCQKRSFGTPDEKSNKDEVQGNTIVLKSPPSQKTAFGAPQEELLQKTVAQDTSSNLKAGVNKRPLKNVSSNLRLSKTPREIKKRKRKLKWLLRKIDFEAPKEETLSTKFCRLGLIEPNKKSPTTKVQENTSSVTDSLSKNCDSKVKSPLPEKSELDVRDLESAKTNQSDKGKKGDSKRISCIRSGRDPRLAAALAKEKKICDVSLSVGDVNGKLQEALNMCKLALKRKCETVVNDRKIKNFKADTTSQDDSVSDNPISCDESKDSPRSKSSLFNKLIQLNSPKMPRERVITLDESSSEDSDDDSVLSLTTSDILPYDNGAIDTKIDEVIDTVNNETVQGNIANQIVDVDVTNKTIDIDTTNRTIDIDITNETIDINDTVDEVADKDISNEVVDMDISQSPTYDDGESPNRIEGLEPAEFYKSRCDSAKRLIDPEAMTNIGSEIRNLCKPSNHQNLSHEPRQASSRCASTLVQIETVEKRESNSRHSHSNVLSGPPTRSESPDFQAYQSILSQHDNFSKFQSYRPSISPSQSPHPSRSLFSPFISSPSASSPDSRAYRSFIPGDKNFSQYQSFLPGNKSDQPVHLDHFDVEPLEKSDFYETDPDYLKPASDWHYIDNLNESSSKKLDTDDSAQRGDFEIVFGQPSRTDDSQTSGNSLPSDQSVPSLNQNVEDRMDLPPGVNDTPLPPNEISCSRIPLPEDEISHGRDSLPPNEISCSRIPPPEDEIFYGRDSLPLNEISCSRIPLPEDEIFYGRDPFPPNEISCSRIPHPEDEISFGRDQAPESRIPFPENEISFSKTPVPVEEELLCEIKTGPMNVGEVSIGSNFRNESEYASEAWVGSAFAEARRDLALETAASFAETFEPPPSEVAESTIDDGIKEAEKFDHLNPAWDFWRELDNDKDRYRGVRRAWRNSRIPNPKLNLTIRNSQRRNGFAPPVAEKEGQNANSAPPTIPCETVFMDQVAENIRKYDEKIDALQDSMEYELQTQTLNHENTIRNCPNPSLIPEIERLHFTALHKTQEFFEKQRDELIKEKEANDLRLKTASNLVVSFHRFYDNLDGDKPTYSTRLTPDEYEEIMEVNKILERYSTFYK